VVSALFGAAPRVRVV